MRENVKLKPELLSFLRHYVSLMGPQGRENDRSDVYISQQLKRLLFTSNHMLHNILDEPTTHIKLSHESCFLELQNGDRCYSEDIRVLMLLQNLYCGLSSNFVVSLLPLSPIPQTANTKQVVSAIYMALKTNLKLSIANSLRTRLVDQVLNDNKNILSINSQEEGNLSIFYGVSPVCQISKEKGDPYQNVTPRRDENSLTGLTEEDEDVSSQLKRRSIEELYAVEVLSYPLVNLNMEQFNILSLLQYSPLPILPHLKKIKASYKLIDLHPSDIATVYNNLIHEINQATDSRCFIDLSNNVLLCSTSYKQQEVILKKLIQAFKDLYEYAKSDVTPKFNLLHCSTRVYLPLSETRYINSYLRLMNTITTSYILETRSDKWTFRAKMKDPHANLTEPTERYAVTISVYFNDTVIMELDGKDFVMIE